MAAPPILSLVSSVPLSGGDGLGALCEGLATGAPALRILNLAACGLTEDHVPALHALSVVLQLRPSIEQVGHSITSCRCDVLCFPPLCHHRFSVSAPPLCVLQVDLDANFIGDKGAAVFIPVLSISKHMRKFRLSARGLSSQVRGGGRSPVRRRGSDLCSSATGRRRHHRNSQGQQSQKEEEGEGCEVTACMLPGTVPEKSVARKKHRDRIVIADAMYPANSPKFVSSRTHHHDRRRTHNNKGGIGWLLIVVVVLLVSGYLIFRSTGEPSTGKPARSRKLGGHAKSNGAGFTIVSVEHQTDADADAHTLTEDEATQQFWEVTRGSRRHGMAWRRSCSCVQDEYFKDITDTGVKEDPIPGIKEEDLKDWMRTGKEVHVGAEAEDLSGHIDGRPGLDVEHPDVSLHNLEQREQQQAQGDSEKAASTELQQQQQPQISPSPPTEQQQVKGDSTNPLPSIQSRIARLGFYALVSGMTLFCDKDDYLQLRFSVLGHPPFLFCCPQSAIDIDGNKVEFSKFQGKVVLIVNVASACGYTDQNYKGESRPLAL